MAKSTVRFKTSQHVQSNNHKGNLTWLYKNKKAQDETKYVY